MLSRLQRICDAIMEAAWLAALVVTPLFFNVYSQRVFEPDKISLLRSLALIAGAAWVVFKVEDWRRGPKPPQTPENLGGAADQQPSTWLRRPLVAAVLALAVVYLFSTLLSITPRQSFWGSYQRLQGAFTMFSYMALFFVAQDRLRSPGQWQRLQYTIILTSLPIALYGILQHLALDPLPWGGDTRTRVAANMGNSIFVAAYLILVIPLTIERLITAARRMLLDASGGAADALIAGSLLFVLVVQMVGVIYTQSRGPWLGLAAGLYVFILLGLTSLRQNAADQGRLRVRELGLGMGMGLVGMALSGVGLLALQRLPGAGGPLVLGLMALLAAALYLAPLLLRRGWRWLWLSAITQSLIGVVLLVFINLPGTLQDTFRELPYFGRLAQILETDQGTGRVRVLIWEGVIDMLGSDAPLRYPDGRTDTFAALRPWIGYGPESMWVAYNRFYLPELGNLEQRNASPDRSHNETFDSLSITGLVGFAAYMLLFGSVFYFALRWLQLIRSRRDGVIFILFALIGAVTGVVWPAWAGQLHLAGVGMPFGLIAGVILYITYAAARQSESPVALSRSIGYDWRRRLVIIALLATVVAHFIEIHSGIAIVSTRTYFFILIAALAAIGAGRLHVGDAPLTAGAEFGAPTQPAEGGSRRPDALEGGGRGQPGGGRSQPGGSRKPKSLEGGGRGQPGGGRGQRTAYQAARTHPFWQQVLPLALILTLILVVLAWDFISNQLAYRDTLTIFWQSWVTHLDPDTTQIVSGPGALWIVLFTLIVGLMLTLAETWIARPPTRKADSSGIVQALGAAAGISLLGWLGFGLPQASRLRPLSAAQPLESRADFVAGHIDNFYVWLAFFFLLVAFSIYRLSRGNRPSGAGLDAGPGAETDRLRWSHRPALAAAVGLPLLILALVLIVRVNLNLVRADIYFKLGQNTDSRREWSSSLIFYRQAAELMPDEDYYKLFLGRALLESARAAQTTDGAAPDETTKALLDQAAVVLTEARDLNPLNTDHSANLARYYATRAGTLVGQEREAAFREALTYYEQATQLSPNAAHLQNEWASIYQALGETENARARFRHSIEIDPRYADTYLRLGLLETEQQNWETALEAYTQATERAPRDSRGFNGRAYVLAQLGRNAEAIAANLQVLNLTPANAAPTVLSSTLQNLAVLYQKEGDYVQALSYAQRLRALVAENQVASVDALIQQLQGQIAGGEQGD